MTSLPDAEIYDARVMALMIRYHGKRTDAALEIVWVSHHFPDATAVDIAEAIDLKLPFVQAILSDTGWRPPNDDGDYKSNPKLIAEMHQFVDWRRAAIRAQAGSGA